jgi:D-alanyl-D-alanine carboxypeptidase (penicillin-binding protein 5/6)
MYLLKRFSAVLTAFTLAVSAVFFPAFAEEKQNFEILFELDTGEVLYSENKDIAVPVGMMNKLMTILAAAKETEAGRLPLDKTVYAPAGVTGEKGASVWLRPGDAITVEELYKSVIIGNANDAALTLAVAAFGSEEKYLSRASEIGESLGLTKTVFTNASGFRDPEAQISTAADIAKIISALSKIEFIEPMFVNRLDYVRNGDAQLVNTNKMARSYNGCIGFKYTFGKETGHSLAVGADHGGTRFGAVLIGSPDDAEMYIRAAKMLDAAFEYYMSYTPKPPSEMVSEIRVKNGYAENVAVVPVPAAKYVIKKSQSGNFETRVIMPEYVYAPVSTGQIVGEVHYYLEGEYFCKTPIVADGDVDGVTFGKNLAIILKKCIQF